MTLKEHEGHGKFSGFIKGPELTNIPVCRFRFPRFPMDETKLILGISKNEDEQVVKERKKDLNKIINFLVRQTHESNPEKWEILQKLNFWEFLLQVGMFAESKSLDEYTDEERQSAKVRYLNALSVSIKGTAAVFMKRKVKDLFINGYNKRIMRLFQSNHDIQVCIDQYSCAQYICGYLTKNEAGMSKLLKAVNEETTNLKQLDRLNALAAVLDKHREVSIQEAIYRLLSLSMTKSSVIVKYLSTIHPHFRDGLLKGKIDELDEDESIFHNSPHQYYENRPEESGDQDKIIYDPEELQEDYWKNLCLAEFWAKYDIVYGKLPKPNKNGKTNIIPLKNKKGFIRRRSKMAVLRYYLNYTNDEDLARGLLVLFLPFQDEMKEIHTQDVKALLSKFEDLIESKRSMFEKYKLMTDLISTINAEEQDKKRDDEDTEGEDEDVELETTSAMDIEEFNKWARNQAEKDLSSFKNLINVADLTELRTKISSLNQQQRRLFDDFTERCISTDVDEQPVYLFIAGNAGTGKSFLVQLLIEAVKLIKIKSGDDLQKPPVIVMAPTGNAAFLIGGKTIDSVLGFTPNDPDRYTEASPGKMATMKFQFENVSVIFCDEISMVGSKKLLKINYRLQNLVDGDRCQAYMGGISFVASGDLWQLPPVKDKMVTEKNNLDGRPDFAPSHWNQYFKIFYLTEKMRSQKDPFFSDLCDRVGRGKQTLEDEKYLKSRIQNNPSENSNESFKNGKLSIIVTTNPKKDLVNLQKMSQLLPFETDYVCDSVDRVTNLPVGNTLPEKLKENTGKTANLQTQLILRVGSPIILTTNHSKKKYREDGIVNGARGFVHDIQACKQNPEKVEVIWAIFNNEAIGKLYRFENNHLRKSFNPGNKLATPIVPTRKNFKIKFGNVEYQRQNFAVSLAYAITAHKCQGETLEEVIIDFGPDKENKIQNYICAGSFYVALTRVREGCKVFLRSFDASYIQVNQKIEEKIEAMIKYRSYIFKKVYLDQKVFVNEDSECKLGYLNINGLKEANHCEYFNADRNLSNLDVIVIAETKLGNDCQTETLKKCLINWNIVGRFDSNDQRKHMGLLLLTKKESIICNQVQKVSYRVIEREGTIQIQGIILSMTNGLTCGFIYCRSTPTESEIKKINQIFEACKIIMGDFNLSHRIARDQQKLHELCQKSKINALREITRSISNNQLDYILVERTLEKNCFVTSFNNFISDHKSITARIGLNKNEMTEEILSKLTFNRESHLKAKQCRYSTSSSEDSSTDSDDDQVCSPDEINPCHSKHRYVLLEELSPLKKKNVQTANSSNDDGYQQESRSGNSDPKFKRKFFNEDKTICWLNASLQLLLILLDHSDSTSALTSDLGKELQKLKNTREHFCLDPKIVREILVTTEDTRVATELSQLLQEITNHSELEIRSRAIERGRFDLISGQQCVRDFFLCLQANVFSWPDITSFLFFDLSHSSTCLACNQVQTSLTTQVFVELDVPTSDESLGDYVSEYLNISSLVGVKCESCSKEVQKEKNSRITSIKDTEFLTVILTRYKETPEGIKYVSNEVTSTKDLFVR